jgi:DNA-binding IclR family transcriptional regulator
MRVDQSPSTLQEAHELLWRARPRTDADPQEWAAFHRHCATVYAATAKVDPQHQYEATQCAGLEMRKARDIEHLLSVGGDDE